MGDSRGCQKDVAFGKGKSPLIFKLAGPSCVVYGKCKEVSSCGEPYKNVEEVLADVLDF